MPAPLLAAAIGPAIGAATGLISTGINAAMQYDLNRQQKAWNEKMYNLQRQHAIDDFNMQNAYNSPQQQMQRLKEAGLNPNMVYGRGTIDNFGGSIKQGDVKGWQPGVPRVDLSSIGDAFSQIADLKLKAAQTDNLRSAVETSKEQRALLAAQALKTAKDTDAVTFRTMRDTMLLDYQVDAAAENTRKLRAETSSILGSNERSWQMHDLMKIPTFQGKLAEIANIKAKTANTKLEAAILTGTAKKLQTENYYLGITKGQEVQMNNILQQKGLLENLMIGERTATEKFTREMEQAKFSKSQIDQILKIILPYY